MEKIIKAAVDRGASDLHIKAGDVFRARIDGTLVPLTKQALTPEQTRSIAMKFIPNEEDRAKIDELLDYDCSWGAQGIGRFRVNILRQRSSFMIVMRLIPFEVPTFETLVLPPVLKAIADADRGMVLVTGLTGSGKSSTTAAMINHINVSKGKHVVTLENPIEYLHRDIQSSITQREIGMDTESLRFGLRAALRQDPDVILIGEMHDSETIDAAMNAVENGRLVISTSRAPDVESAVMGLLAISAPQGQGFMRMRLAESLRAVVSQRLLPRKDGRGRVAACEIMIMTPAIRDLMLDRDRIPEIRDHMVAGRDEFGMQTFDQHLVDLVRGGDVELAVALAASTDPAEFELAMRTGAAAGNPSAPGVASAVRLRALTPNGSPKVEGLSTSYDFLGQ
jgi:twitching motility protein PilT